MRNWNYLRQVFTPDYPPCFYSTYEELKQYQFYPIAFITFGFYSTYEELKRPL